MSTHADKTQDNKNQPVTHERIQQHHSGEVSLQFADARQEAIAQRKLQTLAHNSPQAMQLKSLQATAMGAGALQRQKTKPAPTASDSQAASIAHNSSHGWVENSNIGVSQLAWNDVVKDESIAAVKYTFETYKDNQAAATTAETTLTPMKKYTKQQQEARHPFEQNLNKANTTKGLAFAQMDAWHKEGTKPKKALAEPDVATKAKGSWNVDGKPFKEIITGANQIEATEAQAAYDSVVGKDGIALGKEADTQDAARKDETLAGLESTAWGWGVNLAFVEAAVDLQKEITLVTPIPEAAKAVLAPGNDQRFTDYVTASHTAEAPWRSLWQGLAGRPTWYTYELDYLKRRGFRLDGVTMAPPGEVGDHTAAEEAPAIGHATPYTYSKAYKV